MRPVVRALLTSAIDYAGLFPPAALTLGAAAARYRQYLDGPDAWMLGRFVVPASRVPELVPLAAAPTRPGAGGAPWRLSVLIGEDAAPEAAGLRRAWPGVQVDAVEARAPNAAAATRLLPALDGFPEVFVEVTPGPDLVETLAAIRAAGAGAKLRTGGVEAAQFPSAGTVADVLLACARLDVPLKATAGLHHAVRGRYRLTYASDSPCGTMFGFLNVVIAAALARALVRGGLAEPQAGSEVVSLLEETAPEAFAWQDASVSWRGHRFDAPTLAEVRRSGLRSIGSCAFDEPIAELGALGLL